MNLQGFPTRPWRDSPVMLLVGGLLAACTAGDTGQSNDPAEVKGGSNAAQPAVTVVKACSLATIAEVEAAVGRKAMEPVEDNTAGRMSVCTFGEPGAPMIAGRPLANVAVLTVVTGGNDYFEGPVAQVRATFDMAASNADELEVVDGLADRAHWVPSSNTLRIVQGPHLLEIEIPDRDQEGNMVAEPRAIAQQIGKTILARLP